MFLRAHLIVSLLKTLLTSGNSGVFANFSISLLQLTALISYRLALLASLLYLLCVLNETLSITLFFGKILLALKIVLLLVYLALHLNSFSELSNRHFAHEAVVARLSWVEALSTLDWNLLKFSQLSDELFFLSQFGSLLVS